MPLDPGCVMLSKNEPALPHNRVWVGFIDDDLNVLLAGRPLADKKPANAKSAELGCAHLELNEFVLQLSGRPVCLNPKRRIISIHMKQSISGERVESPNDPKLSDGGVRRGTCTAGGKAAVEAGAVTHGAVRCSAWLGVWFDCIQDSPS